MLTVSESKHRQRVYEQTSCTCVPTECIWRKLRLHSSRKHIQSIGRKHGYTHLFQRATRRNAQELVRSFWAPRFAVLPYRCTHNTAHLFAIGCDVSSGTFRKAQAKRWNHLLRTSSSEVTQTRHLSTQTWIGYANPPWQHIESDL